jgi:hypothetical protein
LPDAAQKRKIEHVLSLSLAMSSLRQSIVDARAFASDPLLAREQTRAARESLVALSGLYPGFAAWWDRKVEPGLADGSRALLLEWRDGRLAGAAIVKDDGAEKKLCCLRVSPGFENAGGLGVRLFERAFEALGTDRPGLSVSEETRPAFERIFRHFGFEWHADRDGLYRPRRMESAFNGLELPDAPRQAAALESANQAEGFSIALPAASRARPR